MASIDGLEKNALEFLQRSLRLGHVGLVTGAGFSAAAKNHDGESIPTGGQLRHLLWPLAFPGVPFDEDSGLGEIFEVAAKTRGSDTRHLLDQALRVDRETVPSFYEIYLRIPWRRIYTLNFDDLLSTAEAKFKVGIVLKNVSALAEYLPPPDDLAQVFLNGVLADYPNLTFSPPQYGNRATKVDLAYHQLVRDLFAHPTVFIGTQLDEPPLWQHIAMRGNKPERELRPRSYLVTESLPVARAAMLERYNVRHIPMDAEEFAELILSPIAEEMIARPVYTAPVGDPFELVAGVLADRSKDPQDFLLGREPDWSDITDGYAIEREFEGPLLDLALRGDLQMLTLSGTAGSGKSTTMRRLAISLQAEGKQVAWLRSDAPDSVLQIRRAAGQLDVDVVMIDRADRFGEVGVEMLIEVLGNEAAPLLVASFSSTNFDEYDMLGRLSEYRTEAEVVPLLSDSDILKLLDALARAHRLGRLQGLSDEDQFRALKSRASRQLLVAMLEATSGEKFEDKIRTECETLAPDLSLAYSIAALGTSLRYEIRREDLLACLSDVSASGLTIVDRLERQHMVLRIKNRRIVCRHSMIARQVVDYYKASGQIGEAIRRLGYVIAAKLYPDMPRTPEKRLVTTLVNHDYLRRSGMERVPIQELYAELEPFLEHDAHYWLQRGSYELERGDLTKAEVFLAQAKAKSHPNDYMVNTEWAYLMLQRACDDPTDSRALEWFRDGFEILLDLVGTSGRRTVNTYVVLGQKTVEWCRVSGIDVEDSKRVLQTVRDAFVVGGAHHVANRQFAVAKDQVDRAYLELAVDPDL